MSGNLSLLTVLFIMCYFIKEGGNVIYTTITRDPKGDYFTDVCNNCLEYSAEPIQQPFCRCKWPSLLFLGSKKRCIHEGNFMLKEDCQEWPNEFIKVIDTEEKDSEYTFYKEFDQSSCQLEPLISYHNNTMGKWQFLNLSENVFALHSGPHPSLKIKVTQVSPSLKNFKGYVMKLGLKCIKLDGNTEESSCLLFKAKGKMHYPLDCSVSDISTTFTPPITTSTITGTLVTSPIASCPSIIVTPTITCTACTASSSITPPPKCNGPRQLPPGIIAAIVIGAVLCLSVIFTLVVMYRYRYICKTRRLQARNPDHDFDVIRNPGPQTYRIQEEPLYVELPDILPCGKGSAGSSTNECEDNATVILNPANVYEVQFLVQRRTTAPLPSRPELARNTNTQVEAGAVYQNDESEAIGERAENSIVFKNPEVEASSSSLSRSEYEPERHAPEGQSIADHQHHVEDDVDNSTVHNESEGASDDHYQRLVQGKRPRSVFICQSCNDNPVYQRLSMPHSCPHGAKDKLKLKENRASYESLSGLGSQESVYERPSQTTGEPAAEDKGNMNSEEGDGQPEYHTLEQEETAVSNEEDFTKPVNHDYNVLEGPGETGDEVDERAKDSISRDPDQTSEDSDSSQEPSKILNMEDNPAYAKPWKTKEDPDLPLEPSDILNIEHNPLYSTPLKAKTAEPCSRRRAYSM